MYSCHIEGILMGKVLILISFVTNPQVTNFPSENNYDCMHCTLLNCITHLGMKMAMFQYLHPIGQTNIDLYGLTN